MYYEDFRMDRHLKRFAMGKGIRAVLGLLTLAFGSAAAAGTEAAPAPRPWSFGVVPQQSASELARLWTPILSYLSEKTGYRLDFKTAKDIPVFEQRLAAGGYDIAYMNPYHYTVFHRSPGYRVFAKERGRKLKGIVVVRKDSPYQDVAQLKGKTIAFPAPAAFAATVLPLSNLKTLGIPIEAKYVASHDSVYLSVFKGLYPAGGGIMRTFENFDPGMRDRLRILWTTPEYTPHAIAAHPRVPPEVVQRLQEAMIRMHEDPRGAALLGGIGFKGLAAAHDAEYDDIRRLDIRLLDHLIKE